MKIKTVTVPPEVMEVLNRSTITAEGVTLPPGQLSRPLYEAVNRILLAAGGRWNRKSQSHLFDGDPRERLGMLEEGKVVNQKQTYQFFSTPPEIVNRMMLLADVGPSHRVLEPSAGDGSILKEIVQCIPGDLNGSPAKVVACEIEDSRHKLLCKRFPTVKVYLDDFLKLEVRFVGQFDRILMNPPFTRGQDMKHIQHARQFLRPGGRLVAICLNGVTRADELNSISSYWDVLPPDTFKASGTPVSTVLLMIKEAA